MKSSYSSPKKAPASQRGKKNPNAKAVESNPRENMEGFDVGAVVRDIESAVTDAGPYYARIEANERTRLCQWAGKNGTGRKKSSKEVKAWPWENAADMEVHLAQEVCLQLTAQRTAAMMRGALNVTPMQGTKARAASSMKLVLRYYLETAMRGERAIKGTRWASWTLHGGHAVMYVGWLTVKAMEKREITESALVEYEMAREILRQQEAGQDVAPVQGDELREGAEARIRAMPELELAALMIDLRPELKARAREAEKEALRAVRELRADLVNVNRTGHYFAAYVKDDRPVWEALRQGVDFLCPAETQHEESFDGAPWLCRIRWLTAQQVLEMSAMHDWDKDWTNQYIAKCKGKAVSFSERTSRTPWALSGLGVGWTTSEPRTMDAEKNLYQVLEYYDRRVTSDGAQCTYRTLMHPDIKDKVAKRELLEDWHGHYPFVPAVNEQDQSLLLANRGVPELVRSAQNAIKTQWDSRDDAAALATVPPWTGPEGMEAIKDAISPGGFIPSWRTGEIKVLPLPAPDNRSVEIEKTYRAAVDRYFGLMSKEVPEPLSMLLGQVGVDWFLTAYSRAIALTAQLIQQRMPTLVGARITGTDIIFNASREDVRGSFDFSVKFDVRALDLEWVKNILGFVKDVILPMDNKGLVSRRPFLEMGINMIDSSMTDRTLLAEDDALQNEIDDEQRQLSSIFSGGVPNFIVGGDHEARAAEMQRDLAASPMRQQLMATNEAIAAVWEDRLQKHLHQGMQQNENRQAGIEGGSDPLKQSPLAKLKSEGWRGMVPGVEPPAQPQQQRIAA